MTAPASVLRKTLVDEANLELVRRSSPGAIFYALLLVVVEWVTPYADDHPWIIGIVGVSVTILGGLRILYSHRIVQAPHLAPAWGHTAFRYGVFLSALIWGAFSGFSLARYGEHWTGLMVLLMTAGISAGGSTSLAPDLGLTRAYLVIMLAPSVAGAFFYGGQEGIAIALTVSIYVGFLIVGSAQQHSNYWRAIEGTAALKVKAAELEEATKLADAATIAKSTFLANMSHEIRTPMNAVIGMSDLLMDSNLDSHGQRCARTIKEASESLLAIVNDILDLSRIEAGKIELDSTDFNLRDTVHDVLRTLALRAHDKGLELSCRVANDVPDALTGDSGRLKQILINLVGNAVKFTSRGSIRVRIERMREEGGVGLLHFSVTDTGIGIPAEKQPLIFRPFTQADSTTTRQYGGTGLGLTISKALTEMMNGRMWMESESEKGSTFHFTVLLRMRTVQSARLPEDGIRNLRGLNVLVVENDPENRRILGEMLQSWGMLSTLVDHGEAARALTTARTSGKEFAFSLIEAQAGEGFETAALLWSADRNLIPIMMLTSNRQREGAARCRDLGIKAYLVKPISESELFDALMTAQGGTVSKPAQQTGPGAIRRLRILLAEDNPVNQLVAQGLLERLGHTLVIAPNGRILLEHLKTQHPFDLIFMDIQMPEMDGFQATAAIRELEKAGAPHIPIIAMTAHAMKGDRERCLAAGMDGYVAKPVQGKMLHEAIEAVGLGGHNGESPPCKEDSPIFDRDAVLDRLGGNSTVVRNVLKLFNEDTPERLSQIRDAIDDHDCKQLVESAHALKGSLLVLSADAAAGVAQKLESMGRAGELTGAAAVMSTLEAEVSKLTDALPRLLEGLA